MTLAPQGAMLALTFVFSAIILCHPRPAAESAPQPPCQSDAVPTLPELASPATVTLWSHSSLGRDWIPPACTGWSAPGFTTLVTTVARFRYTADADGLLRRIGAISALSGLRYWSTTHKGWETLVLDAHALTGIQSPRRRADFAPSEMAENSVLYFEQTDNLSGKAVYRMRLAQVSAARLVFEIENVTPLRYFLITVVPPAEIQSVYFLDRESPAVWRFYSIVRLGKKVNWIAGVNESSSVNRAVAYYRSLIGIPAAQEPPAAP